MSLTALKYRIGYATRPIQKIVCQFLHSANHQSSQIVYQAHTFSLFRYVNNLPGRILCYNLQISLTDGDDRELVGSRIVASSYTSTPTIICIISNPLTYDTDEPHELLQLLGICMQDRCFRKSVL